MVCGGLVLCSGSEAGSYLRAIDFVYHSTLGLRVIRKKKGLVLPAPEAPIIKLPRREAGSPNHLNDKVDSDQ